MMVKIRCILVLRNAVCMNKPTGNQVLQLCLACFFAERMSLVNGHQVVHVWAFADSASDDNASGSEGYEMLLLACFFVDRISLVNGHQVVHGVFADSASDDNALDQRATKCFYLLASSLTACRWLIGLVFSVLRGP